MKIQVAGGTGQQSSEVWDGSRSINCYPLQDPTGAEQTALYGTSGYTAFGSGLGAGPWRKLFPSRATGRRFGISGSQLFEINADGTGTAYGNLLFSSGTVYMEENPTQLAICDTVNLYIFSYTTNTLQRIQGNLSYVTNGTFTGGATSWTLGSGWTGVDGYIYAASASTTAKQTTPLTLISGKTYTLTYTLSDVQFVTDGTFNSSGDWTQGTGWSVANNTAIATGAISTDLTQTAAATLVSGNTYQVTFTVVRTAGSVAVSLGGGTAGTSISASGTVTQTITAGSTQVISFAGSSFTGTIAAVSIIPTTSGSITANVGGTDATTRSAAGTYTESIVAGSTQVLTFTGSSFTGTISAVTLRDLAYGLPSSVSTLDYIDGFFVVSKTGTKAFYKSAANDGTSWDALDFASKSSEPDNLGRVKRAVGQLWLFGQYSSEVWTNTGASLFPFAIIAGAKISVGIAAPDSAIELDNSVFWIGQDKSGKGIVYRANGFVPQRISTTAIEILLAAVTDMTLLRGWSFQENGHLFYVITGGDLTTSPVYDVTTQQWHERAYLESDGTFSQFRGVTHMFFDGKQIIGDYETNALYQIKETAYDDDGNPLVMERITPTVTNENQRVRFNKLQLLMETGVGNANVASPLVELYVSRDGARTWVGVEQASIGAVGAYQTQTIFRNLGVAQTMTFKIRISDPAKRAIVGAYLS